MPTHHVPAEALLAYAAGTTTMGQEVLVACHLTVCPSCRTVVERAEAACARALLSPGDEEAPAVAVPPALLARLDEPAPRPAVAPHGSEGVFPTPLARWVGPLASLPWRALVPGVRVHVVRELTDPAERVFLVDFRPGARLPRHDHTGVERALVVRGGYRVADEAHAAGDVSWRETTHEQVIVDDHGPCTTLFVSDGRLRFGLRWLDALVDQRMMR